MSATAETILNQDAINRIRLLSERGRLAHAYLFAGPHQTGKSETALAAAKMLNCSGQSQGPSPSGFCGWCPSCVKIAAGNHPDVHCFDSGFAEPIRIEQVREMLSRMKLRPFEAKKKIFILKNVENLTIDGSNALLKTLEEPSDNTLLFLTTSAAEKIPETVRSRCQTINFRAGSVHCLGEKLTRGKGVSPRDARFLAYLSDGSPGRAEYLSSRRTVAFKDKIIEDFILSGGDESFLDKVLADKEKTRDFLDIVLSFIRDCVLIKSGIRGDRLVHQEYEKAMDSYQCRFTPEGLDELNREVTEMYRMLTENLNIKIPLLMIKEKLWVN